MECPICFENIKSTRNCCTTLCGHSFCFVCIQNTLQKTKNCPCCRRNLLTGDEAEIIIENDGGNGDEDDEGDSPTIDLEEIISRLTEDGLHMREMTQLFLSFYIGNPHVFVAIDGSNHNFRNERDRADYKFHLLWKKMLREKGILRNHIRMDDFE